MTEITLKDGRIFNSRFRNIQMAIDDINDYLFCEYNDHIEIDDIAMIETFTIAK